MPDPIPSIHESYAIVDRLNTQFRKQEVPEAVDLVKSIIPGSLARVDMGKVLPGGAIFFPRAVLTGRWVSEPGYDAGPKTLNKRGILTIVQTEDDLLAQIDFEKYFDSIINDQIVNGDISRSKQSTNPLFGINSDQIAEELLRECEGFSLIPPGDLPSVINEMKKHEGKFDWIMKAWKSWNVLPKQAFE